MPARAVRISLGVALLAAGCAGASPPYTEKDLQVLCETHGGIWHAALAREGHCEYQSPGMI
jgi:hypothetical protein